MKIYEQKDAILVIDMLNDFVLEGAPLEVKDARRIIPNINAELTKARDKGIPIIYVNDSHFKDDLEFRIWPRHCISGTSGAEVVKELLPKDGDYIIKKRKYSGFVGTGLSLILKELDIQRVILIGIVTEVCVLHTASDAYQMGYKVVILKDCVASLSKEEERWALRQMERLYKAEIL